MSSSYRESVDALRANALYVVLTAVFGGLLLWDSAFLRLATYAPYGDYWEHAALFTEWLNNFTDPANPHVNSPDLSPRFMPLYWALTFLGLAFGLDAFDLLAISALFNYVLIVIGLHLFLKNYFRDNWAPLFGFIAIFLCWGVSWVWSNLYHFRSFLYVASFPSSFVFGLSLISFYVSLRLLRRDGSEFANAIWLCLLTALMFIAHPLTGVFGIVGCGLLALICRTDGIGLRVITLFALVMGLFFAEQWPYFSPMKLSLGLYGAGAETWSGLEGMTVLERLRSDVWLHIFYLPDMVAVILGPTLIGLPLCLWLLIRRDYLFIVAGAAVMAVPYLVHPFYEVPLAHRFLLFVATFFQFAIVAGALAIKDIWFMTPRPPVAKPLMVGMLGLIAVLFAWNITLVTIEFSGSTLAAKTLSIQDKHGRLPEGKSVVELYQQLTQPMNDDSVVLTTPMEGWPLPSVKGKVVSLYHPNPMLLDQMERYVATTRFFEEDLSDVERAQVVGQYEADHLLIKGDSAPAGLVRWLGQHALLVAKVGDYRMYRLQETASAGYEPPPPLAEDTEETGEDIFAEEAETVIEPESQPEVPSPEVQAEPPARPASVVEESGPDHEPVRPDTSVTPDIGSFGTPLTEPMITESDGEPPELPEGVPVEKMHPALKEKQVPDEVVKEQKRSQNYGVPISDPVLDPSRHGAE